MMLHNKKLHFSSLPTKMDSNIPLNLTTFALLVPALFLILKIWNKSKSISYNLPPGPKTLPIIGHLHLLSALTFRSFRDLSKQYGPIMHLKLGEIPVIVVSSIEIAKQVLKEQDLKFADRPGSIAMEIMWYNYKDIAFSPYGGYWRQMRKICILELLSPKNVRSFVSIRNDEVSRLVEFIEKSNGKPVNLTEKVFDMSSSITCRSAFGMVCKDSEELIDLVKGGLHLASGFLVADLYPSWRIFKMLSWGKVRLLMMRRKLDKILDEIIHDHELNLAKMGNGDKNNEESKRKGNGESGSEDLIDVFLRIKQGGELEFPITNDNIKAIIYDLFGAGTETSSTTIDWAMAELLRSPRIMKKVQDEVRDVFKGSKIIDESNVHKLKYLKCVVKEVFRLHPPIPILPRATREDITIIGYTIPAKVKVLVNNWAMQRDPMYWTNPESFEPERFETNSVDFLGADYQFLPFGSGRRMCPGMQFGLADVELPLAQLLYSFDWRLPDGVKSEDLGMVESPGLTAARKDGLIVVATPYH